MHHAITVLLPSISILGGLILATAGALMCFRNFVTQGCIVFCLGAAFVVGGVWGLLS